MAQRENLTPADLARLTDEERRSVELAEGASPGPWGVSAGDEHLIMDAGPHGGEYVCCMEGTLSNPRVIADRDFIADARTAVPRLADEVARLRGRVEKLERVAEAAKALWVHEAGTTRWAPVSEPLREMGNALCAASKLERE